MMRLLHYLVITLVLCACAQTQDEDSHRAKIEENVIQAHDEAMNNLSTLYHLRHNLRALRDSLERLNPDTSIVTTIQANIRQLNIADEAMKDWMRQYHTPANLTNEHAMEYLHKELLKIENVHALMDSSIASAQATYNTINNDTITTYE